MPVEAMVPALRCIVEEALIAATSSNDDFFKRLVCMVGASNRIIGFRHIGVVMLAMVIRKRLGGNGGCQCIIGIGQVDQFEGHGNSVVQG